MIAIVALCAVTVGLLCTCGNRRVAVPASQQVKPEEVQVITRSYRAKGKRFEPMGVEAALKYKAEGVASYYEANGSRGALGERLRRGEYYAAHPTLPMPCVVRITNLSNGKSCEARVADRGPFSSKRVIDVSSAVAKELDFYKKGIQRVRVEVVSVGDKPNQLKAEE